MEQMFKRSRAGVIYVIATLAACFVAALLRIINIFLFYDLDIGYYNSEAVLPKISGAFYVAAVAFFAVSALTFLRGVKISEKNNSVASRISASLVSIALVVYTIVTVFRAIELLDMGVRPSWMFFFQLFLTLSSIAFFLSVAFDKHRNGAGLLLSFLCILWLVTSLASSYFDNTVSMNSPDKLAFQFACVSAMIYLVYYMKGALELSKKYLYVISSSLAIFLLALSSLPSIVASVLGKGLYNYVLLPEDIVLFAFLIFVISNFISGFFGKDTCPEEVAAEICEEAEILEEEAIPGQEGEATEEGYEESEPINNTEETEEPEETEERAE